MHRAHVITVSDGVSSGTRTDTSGPALLELLKHARFEVSGPEVVPDDQISVGSLEGFYKALWQGDGAERVVSLQIRRDNAERVLQVRTQDRMKTLRRAQGI